MRFSSDDLVAASKAGLIDSAQLKSLLIFLDTRTPADTRGAATAVTTPKFDMVHMLWYTGALIVIGAMGLFSTLAFSQMGGPALTATAVVYAVLFGFAGDHLWRVRNLRIPGGLLIAIAVSMAPLAVYGVMESLGWRTEFGKPGTVRQFYTLIKGSWLFMEIAAIAAAALALRYYRFPFIVLIAAFALWFMSMDVVPWITGGPKDFATSRQVSIVFGLVMIGIAAFVNTRQTSGDFAFWLYLFGVMTFWGGLSMKSGSTDLEKAVFCLMNVVFLFISVFLNRRVFAVFGTIGIVIYLSDLAEKLFKDSLMFPFVLSLIGVAIIALGLYYYKHQSEIEAWFDDALPEPLKRLRPINAIPG